MQRPSVRRICAQIQVRHMAARAGPSEKPAASNKQSNDLIEDMLRRENAHDPNYSNYARRHVRSDIPQEPQDIITWLRQGLKLPQKSQDTDQTRHRAQVLLNSLATRAGEQDFAAFQDPLKVEQPSQERWFRPPRGRSRGGILTLRKKSPPLVMRLKVNAVEKGLIDPASLSAEELDEFVTFCIQSNSVLLGSLLSQNKEASHTVLDASLRHDRFDIAVEAALFIAENDSLDALSAFVLLRAALHVHASQYGMGINKQGDQGDHHPEASSISQIPPWTSFDASYVRHLASLALQGSHPCLFQTLYIWGLILLEKGELHTGYSILDEAASLVTWNDYAYNFGCVLDIQSPAQAMRLALASQDPLCIRYACHVLASQSVVPKSEHVAALAQGISFLAQQPLQDLVSVVHLLQDVNPPAFSKDHAYIKSRSVVTTALASAMRNAEPSVQYRLVSSLRHIAYPEQILGVPGFMRVAELAAARPESLLSLVKSTWFFSRRRHYHVPVSWDSDSANTLVQLLLLSPRTKALALHVIRKMTASWTSPNALELSPITIMCLSMAFKPHDELSTILALFAQRYLGSSERTTSLTDILARSLCLSLSYAYQGNVEEARHIVMRTEKFVPYSAFDDVPFYIDLLCNEGHGIPETFSQTQMYLKELVKNPVHLLFCAYHVYRAGDTKFSLLARILGVSDPLPIVQDVVAQVIREAGSPHVLLVARELAGPAGSDMDRYGYSNPLKTVEKLFYIADHKPWLLPTQQTLDALLPVVASVCGSRAEEQLRGTLLQPCT